MMFQYERLKKSLNILSYARKLSLIQHYRRTFCSGMRGLDSNDIYFREDMFWRYLPWTLDHLVNIELQKINA